uniref:Uncharacterized protein n=1 Tax=Utricularia reniformis TaxID=192314 RepID=A0A1Y0AYT9_9LAMI|nr:hypothetical protein AEK19_MT0843 [Utricularia reniformis]YP_009382294.1 hypothetical protein AEK19_MT1866 [Utricularia reniformis]ART30321.1 hypothetical protein AEK19_MT0843 [Utricularia reniformis]ART30412.1 hypothetical protein AEK19_MT1866 [Utricularia reniformis]
MTRHAPPAPSGVSIHQDPFLRDHFLEICGQCLDSPKIESKASQHPAAFNRVNRMGMDRIFSQELRMSYSPELIPFFAEP